MRNALLNDRTGILYMKVGTHAQEPLDAIIARKAKEIEDEGFALWGYGGNTCHPSTMVQPFGRIFEKRGGRILLCMQEMNSSHFAEQVRADAYSVDGITWQDIPSGINVLGSRYALKIRDLRKVDEVLPLDRTIVAVGNSQGRQGSRYIQGRVDKACLELSPDAEATDEDDERTVGINLVAEIEQPYAFFLKNRT
ncbi:MAG: hypothetical protein JOZ13_10140 [Alphaproteobacteria bacterium]|nr:hypothetical protein [Alphaproteobacteria bacterium]